MWTRPVRTSHRARFTCPSSAHSLIATPSRQLHRRQVPGFDPRTTSDRGPRRLREAARERPHAVADRAAQPEKACRAVVQVDGVVVPRHACICPRRPWRHVGLGQNGAVLRRPGRARWPRTRSLGGLGPARHEYAGLAPRGASAARDLRRHVEREPRIDALVVARGNLDRKLLAGVQLAQVLDDVRQVDEPHGAQRKTLLRKDREVQRHRQHVRIGDGDARPEAAHQRIPRDIRRIDDDARDPAADLRRVHDDRHRRAAPQQHRWVVDQPRRQPPQAELDGARHGLKVTPC